MSASTNPAFTPCGNAHATKERRKQHDAAEPDADGQQGSENRSQRQIHYCITL